MQNAVGKSIHDLPDVTWNRSSQHLNGHKIYLLSVLPFLFCLTKTAIWLLHLLSALLYRVTEKSFTTSLFFAFSTSSWCRIRMQTLSTYKNSKLTKNILHLFVLKTKHPVTTQASVQQNTTATNLLLIRTNLVKLNSAQTLAHICI